MGERLAVGEFVGDIVGLVEGDGVIGALDGDNEVVGLDEDGVSDGTKEVDGEAVVVGEVVGESVMIVCAIAY